MGILSHTKRLIDGKKVFLLWNELGSLKKASKVLEKQGVVNPNTGNPFSDMALWTAAMRWVIENPLESKPYFDKAAASGVVPQEKWEKFLIHRAFKVFNYTPRRCYEWAVENDLYQKHKALFDGKLASYEGRRMTIPDNTSIEIEE